MGGLTALSDVRKAGANARLSIVDDTGFARRVRPGAGVDLEYSTALCRRDNYQVVGCYWSGPPAGVDCTRQS